MSHYVDIVTQIKDRNALVRALGRLGFKDKVEVYEVAQHLYGYQGDKRSQKAHVIIRKRYVGHAANDIGFEKQYDGRFKAHISEFDQGTGQYSGQRGKYGQEWQNKLNTYYGVELSKMEFENKGWEYVEDTDEQNRPRLKVRL